ncbi:ABC transporter permease [Pseudonocardia sp. EC080625-04]|uniref:ABC transporter permease n=1 Tax=unclassified Pseudonocardia TaxID=2619320 RepID=UPI0006CB4F1D|nr:MULTISPECIES: ABC transporter permease [unclassified Pseudonocardia]ALE74000.1 ABC transporter permease [Pseudonocardia sp. EC080625-04]ALL80322.1 ABC transporter permease [Pseudonocardia sp. EC080619-01]
MSAPAAEAASGTAVADAPRRQRAKLDKSLIANPLIALVGLVGVFAYAGSQGLDAVEQSVINPAALAVRLWEHMILTGLSTLVVIVIAIPAGIAISRPAAGRIQRPVLAGAGFMQALPAFGVIVLLAFSPLGLGLPTAVVALALAALLPVLTNTVVGLQQVDRSLIEAARGIGMSARQTLIRVELPLATPVMVAGVRVALVLNVGTAALATFIGAGGLGEPIKGMLELGRPTGTLVAAAIVAALALIVDWLAGLAEYAVRRNSG